MVSDPLIYLSLVRTTNQFCFPVSFHSHIDNVDEPSKLTAGGFQCPQCGSKCESSIVHSHQAIRTFLTCSFIRFTDCELPVSCISCNLTLVSAPHLARSYHHLFPVTNYREIPFTRQRDKCFACQKIFTDLDKNVYQCDLCSQMFCIDCDIFIHDTLHICVGCTTIPMAAQNVHLREPTYKATNSHYPN